MYPQNENEATIKYLVPETFLINSIDPNSVQSAGRLDKLTATCKRRALTIRLHALSAASPIKPPDLRLCGKLQS